MRANALGRAGLNDWKRRSPASFWRVRNGAALARWFWTRVQRRLCSGDSNYDDAFWTNQDGDWDAVAERVDIAGTSRAGIDRVASSLGTPDLAICLEVAEHLPSWHSAKLLRLITTAPTVLFSAAHPNEGGVLHVNERPPEHWQARFAELGYELGARDQEFRARLRVIDLPWWYADNAHVFERATGGSWRPAGS